MGLSGMTLTQQNASMRPALIGLSSPAMGSGKSTVAAYLAERHGFRVVPMAGLLKAMIGTLLDLVGYDEFDRFDMLYGDAKEVPIPELAGKTPRHAMQTLGTEWGRKCIGPDFWVSAGIAAIEAERNRGWPVVVDDLRFTNEADAVVAAGGVMVKIDRPGAIVTSAHASEGELDSYPATFRLTNDGSLTDLFTQVDTALLGR